MQSLYLCHRQPWLLLSSVQSTPMPSLHLCHRQPTWAAQYNPWLIIKLTPKGVVFSFLFSQAALAVAEQQLTQHQQETAAGQAQLEAQAKEISSLQELANVHRATIDNTAQQAEETQQQLTGLVTMLKVRCLAHASVPAHTVCHLSAHTGLLSTYWAL